jgi:hypothetical protein
MSLIHRERLGQIPREIGVEAAYHAHVIGEHQDCRSDYVSGSYSSGQIDGNLSNIFLGS